MTPRLGRRGNLFGTMPATIWIVSGAMQLKPKIKGVDNSPKTRMKSIPQILCSRLKGIISAEFSIVIMMFGWYVEILRGLVILPTINCLISGVVHPKLGGLKEQCLGQQF